SIKEIADTVGTKVPLFRAMPNTAIAIRESMTCISTKNGTQKQKEEVMSLFEKLGKVVLIEDELMAAATVLAACGIAYSLRYIRAASQGGIEIGFDAQTAQLIAAQTVKGAASLLLVRGEHPEKEIDRVTTPQGCTIAGINEMEHQGFSSSLIKGIVTSYKSIEKLV
ncbi:MAG TPA: pyrroline-5-carboxylate reductase dimerization domain-containing protein, partial [Chitinophagales bacterium]|nr:pyrroline-5-carboxylate reductase dimerization domain-containing protein [Chitinophagales bacterium]